MSWNHQLWATYPLMARKRTTASQTQISIWSRRTLTENRELSPKTVITRCFQIALKIHIMTHVVAVVFRYGLNHNRHYQLKTADLKFSDTGKRRNKEWTRIMLGIIAGKIWRRIDLDITEDSYLRSKCQKYWEMTEESMKYIILLWNAHQKLSKYLRSRNTRGAHPVAATNARHTKGLASWRHSR